MSSEIEVSLKSAKKIHYHFLDKQLNVCVREVAVCSRSQRGRECVRNREQVKPGD